MDRPPERFPHGTVPIAIDLLSKHPLLLEGLDLWLKLGLISDQQVLTLCRIYLACPLPPRPSIPPTPPKSVSIPAEIPAPAVAIKPPSVVVAYLLWCFCFVGVCGIHRFYLGKDNTGLLWLFSLGGLGIGQFLDLFFIPAMVREKENAIDALSPPDPSIATPAQGSTTQDPLTSPAPDQKSPAPESEEPTPPARPQVPDMVQSLMAELSIRWILFLGLFLVIVSSGILALSQWRFFSPPGQYGVLLSYSLAFGAASLWASKQTRLQLTARALQILTILLIPVNFWAMDALKLWADPWGIGTIVVGALLLSGVMVQVLHQQLGASLINYWNAVGLSALNWGWAIPGIPIVAVYVGTVMTAANLVYQDRRYPAPDPDDPADDPTGGIPQRIPAGLITLAYASVLLVARALLGSRVPLEHMGLAVGLVGWVLGWLSRYRADRVGWWLGSVALLCLGWGLAIRDPYPWQALAICGLALALLLDRLQRRWQVAELAGVHGVLLLTAGLAGRVIPPGVTAWWRDLWIQWIGESWSFALGGSTASGWLVLGVNLFPYVWLVLGLVMWLKIKDQPRLALYSERVALGSGILFALISLPQPEVRLVNLLLSGLTLIAVLRIRHRVPIFLIYLTHLTLLLAGLTGIQVLWPDLSGPVWNRILVGVMGLEWGFCLIPRWDRWRVTAWWIGLALALLAYMTGIGLALFGPAEGWLWLATPILLTVLCSRRQDPVLNSPQVQAVLSPFSILTIFLAQALTVADPYPRLLGLGVGTVLMVWHSRRLQTPLMAFGAVGLGMAWTGSVLWHVLPDGFPPAQWSMVAGILTVGLWGWFWAWRGGVPLPWLQHYPQALDRWGSILAAANGVFLLVATAYHYGTPIDLNGQWLVAVGLTILALGLRAWLDPSDLLFFAVAGQVEVLLLNSVFLAQPEPLWSESITLANLALGLGLQAAGDGWLQRHGSTRFWAIHAVPLSYGLLGWGLSLWTFTAWSGAYSGLLALIGIGISRRQPGFKPLIYPSLGLVTVGSYQALVYWLLQQPESPYRGNAWILLSGLGLLLAVAYRWIPNAVGLYLRLDLAERRVMGHLHWGLATVLSLGSFVDPLSAGAQPVWVGLVLLLAGYACWQGRLQPGWTYAGMVEIHLALGAGLYWATSDAIFLTWSGPLAALMAVGYSQAPWIRWGWDPQPWQQSALWIPAVWIGVTTMVPTQASPFPALLIGAGYYLWMAVQRRRIQISYVSLALLDWAIVKVMWDLRSEDPLWYVCLIGIVGMALFYRRMPAAWGDYLRWDPEEATQIAHLHWGLTALIAVGSPFYAPLSAGAKPIWILLVLLLAGYAGWEGRHHKNWTYIAIAHGHLALGAGFYWAMPATVFLTWSGPLAALLAVGYSQAPWIRWGWDPQPWQLSAQFIPGIWLLVTTLSPWAWDLPSPERIPSLLLVAAYYGWLAYRSRQIRLSYISVMLADWALLELLTLWRVQDPFWLVTLLCGSILYVAQLDPKVQSERAIRHWLRCLAVALVGVTALVESGDSFTWGLLTIGLGIGFSLLGLVQRIRAYLFVGTLTFMLAVLQLVWLFLQQEALLLWGLGIVAGLLLIWIAASFETRRDQISALLRRGLAELADWD